MTEITYRQEGDYLLPNIGLREIEQKPIGRFGRMRWKYLKEHRRALCTDLLLSGQLQEHLQEIDETAEARQELLLPKLAKKAGATEQLKRAEPMRWVGLMNACQAQIDELIREELIYS